PIIHGVQRMIGLAKALTEALDVVTGAMYPTEQETCKGMPRVVEESGKIGFLGVKSKCAGVGERTVVIEVARVLIPELICVFAPAPGDIVLVDIAPVGGVIGEAYTQSCKGSTLVFVAGKPEGREHCTGQVL